MAETHAAISPGGRTAPARSFWTARRLASAALLPAAALAVHQLRYWLAFGGHAPAELARQGHAYLHSLVPWVVLLVALAAGGWLRSLARAVGGGGVSRRTFSFGVLWLLCAGALALIYVLQELLEGFFATGHASGLAAVVGAGGWWFLPAAACVGLVVASVLHGARRLIEAIAEGGGELRPAHLRAASLRPLVSFLGEAQEPVAAGWSLRGPPLAAGPSPG